MAPSRPVIRRSRDTEFKALSIINAKNDRLTDNKMWREPPP